MKYLLSFILRSLMDSVYFNKVYHILLDILYNIRFKLLIIKKEYAGYNLNRKRIYLKQNIFS